MKPFKVTLVLTGMGIFSALGLLALAASGADLARGQPNGGQPGAKPTATTPRLADRGKGVIERPVKRVIAARSSAAVFVNPRVAPGKVRWHASFTEACAASAKSKRPVLLFHMMGKLDEQFC